MCVCLCSLIWESYLHCLLCFIDFRIDFFASIRINHEKACCAGEFVLGEDAFEAFAYYLFTYFICILGFFRGTLIAGVYLKAFLDHLSAFSFRSNTF